MVTRDYRSLTETEIEHLRFRHQYLRFKLSDLLGISFLTLVLYVGGGWLLGRSLDWLVLTGNNDSKRLFATAIPLVGLFAAAASLVRQERSRRKGLEFAERSLASQAVESADYLAVRQCLLEPPHAFVGDSGVAYVHFFEPCKHREML